MDVGLDSRVAEGTNKNGVKIPGEHGESIRRDGDLVAQITVRTPIEVRKFNLGSGRPDDVNRLRNNFFADAVARDHGDALSGLLF